MSAPLHLSFEAGALHRILDEVASAAAKLPPELVDRLVRVVEAGAELFVVETDSFAASGASHLVMRPKPSDALLVFMAAAGASDPDLGLVENALCHIEASLPADTIAQSMDRGEPAE